MPVYYSYDEKNNLVRSYAMSDCGSNEFVENMKNIASSDDIQDGFVGLVDLERMNSLSLSDKELVQLKDAFTECENKGCKRIILFRPNACIKELKMVRLLKNLIANGTPGKENLLCFTRSHEKLQYLMST